MLTFQFHDSCISHCVYLAWTTRIIFVMASGVFTERIHSGSEHVTACGALRIKALTTGTQDVPVLAVRALERVDIGDVRDVLLSSGDGRQRKASCSSWP